MAIAHGDLPLDGPLTHALRQAARTAGARAVTPEDLYAALASPDSGEYATTRLRVSRPLAAVLARASASAAHQGDDSIGIAHLWEAGRVEAACAAELNLERLWFERWRMERMYGSDAARRCYRTPTLDELRS